MASGEPQAPIVELNRDESGRKPESDSPVSAHAAGRTNPIRAWHAVGLPPSPAASSLLYHHLQRRLHALPATATAVVSAQEGRGRSTAAFLGRRARLLRRTWRPTGAPLRPASLFVSGLTSPVRRSLLFATETPDAAHPVSLCPLNSEAAAP